MTTTTEIYRTANMLIENYGEMAVVGAAIKADQCMQAGDQDGRTIWLRVVRCVEELTEDQITPKGIVLN